MNANFGGEGGIRTLAPCYKPTPLAGEPLRPLGYFSNFSFSIRHLKGFGCAFERVFPQSFSTDILNFSTIFFFSQHFKRININ